MSSWLSRESRGWVRMEAPFRTGVGCVEAGGLVSQWFAVAVAVPSGGPADR